MAKTAKKQTTEKPPMPFNEALKRLWSSPPQHVVKSKVKKSKKSPGK